MSPVASSAGPPSRFAGIARVALLSAAEMRGWDRYAIEEHGIPERVLMETAGRSAAAVVQRLFPEGGVVAAVGGGNNGGDAIVLLRVLRAWGREVAAVLATDQELPRHLLHGTDLPVYPARNARSVFASSGVIIDGILGSGARGAPRKPAASLIDAINTARRPILALDAPSGIDMTTGQAAGAAIRADVTVTFGAPKRGLLLFPGRAYSGRILAVEIGFPPLRDDPGGVVLTPDWARLRLPAVPPNAHKGSVGRILVVAGRPGVAGAAVLAGMGAARAGGGLVLVASPAENRIVLQSAVPEALFVDRDSDELAASIADADAIVAGPGMGTDNGARHVLRRVLAGSGAPLLLDADALTLLSGSPDLLDASADRALLVTPHPGEMSRLLGRGIREITADPFQSVTEAAERFGATVLLKGAPSLVASPGEPVHANVTGHSGIATGGTGDTLAGIAGALLARGCTPLDAGALALYYSGRAAEIAGRGRSLLPRDIADALPAALMEAPRPSTVGVPGVILDLPAAR